VNRDLPELAALVPAGTPTVGFGLGAPAGDDFGLLERGDGAWLARGREPLLPVAARHGRHNVSNALAALGFAWWPALAA
jgi:hypothetical protein